MGDLASVTEVSPVNLVHLICIMPFFWLQLWRSRLLRLALIGGLSLLLIVGSGMPGSAQFSLPSPSPSLLQPNQPPTRVERLGNLEVTSLTVDNTALFKIAAPTVRDRSNPGKQTPVEIRRDQIEANLAWVIGNSGADLANEERGYTTNFDPQSLKIAIAILNSETTLVASDAYRLQPLNLMTVTQSDAEFYGTTIPIVAERWREKLQEVLTSKLRERLPAVAEQNITLAVTMGGVTVLLSALLWIAGWLLRRQEKRLKTQQTQETALADAVSGVVETGYRGEFLELLRQQFSLKRRLSLNSFLRWLVNWGQFVVWFAGIFGVLFLFPASRALALRILATPIQLLLAFFLIGLVNRLGNLVIDRLFQVWEDNKLFGLPVGVSDDAQRRSLRLSTIEQALKGLKTFLVWFIGLTTVLQAIGVPIGSVLAGSAVIAFAVSFSFQSLVKDLVNGCLILWEDQYGIGDVVKIGGATGVVEDMNLRITQIRNSEGRLITMPNNLITQVENLTRRWSRVDFQIEVAYETDVNRAIALLQEIGQTFYEEPAWRDRILDPPEVLGVDELSHIGMLLRVWIRTKPGEQWRVGREYRRRVRVALDECSIQIGVPQQVTTYHGPPPADEIAVNPGEPPPETPSSTSES